MPLSHFHSHEKDHNWQVAKAHADHLHNQDWDSTIADEVVPQLDPHWTYQPNDPGIKRLNHMIICLLEGMQKNTNIHVNYDKIREITQGADENPALFLARLIEAVQSQISPPLLGYSTFMFNSSASPPLTLDASFDNYRRALIPLKETF